MVGKQSNPFELGNTNKLDAAIEIAPAPSTTEPPATEPLPQSRSPLPPPQRQTWKLWLAALGFCGIFGGVGGAAFWWLTTPPPSPDCQQLSAMATDMERLLCAQESARSGDLPKVLAGLELVNRWTPDHPLYREAQRMVAEWSTPVLAAARQRIERSDLRGAVELASRIPKTSPTYKEAQAAIAEWKRYWQKGETISTAARAAMKAQNWVLANEKIAALKDFSQDYWRYDRVAQLTQLMTAERDGRQILAQARTTGQQPASAQLATAIALLSRIDSRTYTWADAQLPLKQWSEILLTRGWQQWQQGNFDEAMGLATAVLKNPNLKQTAQDLLWLSQARKHALASNTTLKPTPLQLWNLSAAIATMQLISPESRYAPQAQTLLKNWQAQLQDLSLLQIAWEIGDLPLAPAKQIAIWQAAQVTRDRPRRAQAQTLLSFWQTDIRRLEDQPYLVYARQLASQGTIPAFQAAIAHAQHITLTRPSRQEAQTLIADWTRQIQTIEDQPILDQAWTLANQGNLPGAIQVASTVAPGRALYGPAQSAISNWQTSIRAAEEARRREREQAQQRSRPPQNENVFPNQPEQWEPEVSPPPEESFPPAAPEIPAPPPPANPSNLYPPGTEPRPSQIQPAPPPTPIYEPPPPPVQSPPPPFYQPYEPVPPR